MAYLDLEGSVCNPTRNESTRVIGSTTQRHKNSTILGMRNLSDEKRRRSKNNTITKTQNYTCRNKHSKVLSSSLKTNSEKHENTTNLYTNLAASPIDQIRHHKETNERAKTHRGIE